MTQPISNSGRFVGIPNWKRFSRDRGGSVLIRIIRTAVRAVGAARSPVPSPRSPARYRAIAVHGYHPEPN